MSSITPPDPWPLPEMQRARRAIVVVDVVESVRLMQEDESGFIDRWRRFVNQVRTEVLPAHGGRLVKSLGDGMLLEFGSVSGAAGAAFAVQTLAQHAPLVLRIGLHDALVVVDELDVYGQGVNLAARLASLGQPGDIVLSDEARDQLIDGFDAIIEDLGPCYLKHVADAVRAFRLSPASAPPVRAQVTDVSLVPAIAVLPLAAMPAQADAMLVARVLSDDILATLSRCPGWRVVSALSMGVIAQRIEDAAAIGRQTGADYLLGGSIVLADRQVRVALHLSTSDSGSVVWSLSRSVDTESLLAPQDRLAEEVARDATAAALAFEWRCARRAALPSLRGYALLLHAISLMHRFSAGDNARALEALEHLVDRHPRAPDARAWMAKWHFMQLPQVQSRDRGEDVQRARGQIARALDLDPDHALAGALEAHLKVYVDREPEAGLAALERALEGVPNEPMAWLFKGNALALLGCGDDAVHAIERACTLSPLDPLGYFYDTFAAVAYRIAGQDETALARAERSVRANAVHLPGWVQLILAQAACGHLDAANASAGRYLALRPQASVQRFVDHHPGRDRAQVAREAQALREAGIPT